jgi:hypothetical protein
MKRTLAITLIALAATVMARAQAPSRGKAQATIGGKAVSIDYGRPTLKGRDMLGQAPAGTVWRMGANEATTIKTEGDLVFGGVTIPKGSYSLFTKRVDDKTWHLLFNKQTGQWGTEHDAKQDVAAVPLAMEKAGASVETLTIDLQPAGSGGEFKLTWGTNVLKAPFQVK